MPFAIKITKKEDVQALSKEDISNALHERREMLHNIFSEAGPDLDPAKVNVIEVKDGADLANQIRQRHDEINWLGERQSYFDELERIRRENDEARNGPAGPDPKIWAPHDGKTPEPQKVATFGELFTRSQVYDAAKRRGERGAYAP